MIDADTSSKRRITTVPFCILSIPPFVREETGWSKVVWSPQGDRFWFSTVLDEEFNSNYYLVDLREGTRRRVLKNTSIEHQRLALVCDVRSRGIAMPAHGVSGDQFVTI